MDLKNPFLNAADNIGLESIAREVYRKKPLTYANEYLDHATGGIFQNDLILIASKTGSGKTELASQIALSNVLNEKRVHFFALEAEKYEIERRAKYRMLSDAFFIQNNWRDFKRVPSFRTWLTGHDDDILKKFEPEVDEELRIKFKNFFVRYRISNFTADTFRREVMLIQDETDLILCDHIHYFDFEDPNENKALKEAVKLIRDVALLIGKPVILMAQLRKSDKNYSMIPNLEDIHGSSDLIKIATRAIIISPAKDQPVKENYIYPTYLRIAKNRIESSTTNFIGICGFDIRSNKYQKNYHIGTVNMSDEVKILETWDYPQWARKVECSQTKLF